MCGGKKHDTKGQKGKTFTPRFKKKRVHETREGGRNRERKREGSACRHIPPKPKKKTFAGVSEPQHGEKKIH